MDRLICGDVGFGKTEIAMRAAFKAAVAGKQVLVLVPTTILAQQHAATFRERFGDLPVSVDIVNRFRTPAETREVLGRFRSGTLDILVGTHGCCRWTCSRRISGWSSSTRSSGSAWPRRRRYASCGSRSTCWR